MFSSVILLKNFLMNKKLLQFAIVGCGGIAERHAMHIHHMGKLAAVCDVVKVKADKIGLKYRCNSYSSLDQLLASEKNIDVVAVCSPNGLHATHTIAALKAGLHVLCEKPMAINSYDCMQMIEVAELNSRKLFVVKQNRYNPPVIAVKELLEKNVLGKIYSVQLNCFWNRNKEYYINSWKGTKEMDGGILFTQFSHFIDLMYWMIGDIKKVCAITANAAHIDSIEFEDCGAAVLEFFNGTIGTINFTINSHKKNMEGSFTIFAEKGTVKIGGEYLNELEYQNIESYEIKNLSKGNGANNYGTYTGSMSNHDKVYKHVIDVLQNNAADAMNIYDAQKTVEIIEKIYAAAKNNKE